MAELIVIKGVEFRDCVETVRHFCEVDAWKAYDEVGRQSDPNILEARLLTTMNSAMGARSPRKAWASLLDKTLPSLADVPRDVDLIDAPERDYEDARMRIGVCYLDLTARPGISDMSASKMLFLKRPAFVVISDSYVRNALGNCEPGPEDRSKLPEHDSRPEARYYSARALKIADQMRQLGREETNRRTLSSIQDRLQNGSTPYSVSKVRILDIMLWTREAWKNGHKKTWGKWGKDHGWGAS